MRISHQQLVTFRVDTTECIVTDGFAMDFGLELVYECTPGELDSRETPGTADTAERLSVEILHAIPVEGVVRPSKGSLMDTYGQSVYQWLDANEDYMREMALEHAQ